MITYFHILLAWARAPSQERTHDFPIKIFSISNHEPNLRTYLPSVVPHSPLSSGHAHGGQWAVVPSGPQWSPVQWSRCDLLHFYRPVIRHTASTTAHHHTDTGISWAYGDWVIFCLFHKICVPLVPVDLRQSPLPLSSQVCQVYNLQTNLRPVTA